MDSKTTGAFINELRKEKGLTQIALAEKLNISNRAVSKWENGDGFPDVTMLPTIAEVLGVTVDELLAGERAEQERPEPIFVNEGKISEKEYIETYRAYVHSRISNSFVIAFTILMIMIIVTISIIDLPNKFLIIAIYCFVYFFLIFSRLFVPRVGAKVSYQDQKAMRKNDDSMRIEFSDKIYAVTNSINQEVEYSSISSMQETKNQIVIGLGRGHFLGLNKNEFTKGDIDEFRQFIKGKVVPNKRDTFRKKFTIVASVLCVAMAVALIPLNVLVIMSQSQQYKPEVIEARASFFDTNKKEFNRAFDLIQNDKEIQESIKNSDYYYATACDYIALSEIDEIEVGKGYICFETYDNEDCYSGYVYCDTNDIPYPYQLGFDHANIENYPFNYISDDDLYLLGKTENDKSVTQGWYLVKILDDNWFYYQYY